MKKDKLKAVPPPVVTVPSANAWTDAQRLDAWVDPSGKEHKIVGVVGGGFDSLCDGVVENFRSTDSKEVRKFVDSWKRKG